MGSLRVAGYVIGGCLTGGGVCLVGGLLIREWWLAGAGVAALAVGGLVFYNAIRRLRGQLLGIERETADRLNSESSSKPGTPGSGDPERREP